MPTIQMRLSCSILHTSSKTPCQTFTGKCRTKFLNEANSRKCKGRGKNASLKSGALYEIPYAN